METDKTMQRRHLQCKIDQYRQQVEQTTGTDEASQRRLSLLNYKIEAAKNRLAELSHYGFVHPDQGYMLWENPAYN